VFSEGIITKRDKISTPRNKEGYLHAGKNFSCSCHVLGDLHYENGNEKVTGRIRGSNCTGIFSPSPLTFTEVSWYDTPLHEKPLIAGPTLESIPSFSEASERVSFAFKAIKLGLTGAGAPSWQIMTEIPLRSHTVHPPDTMRH
jgi:hypothetical protein